MKGQLGVTVADVPDHGPELPVVVIPYPQVVLLGVGSVDAQEIAFVSQPVKDGVIDDPALWIA